MDRREQDKQDREREPGGDPSRSAKMLREHADECPSCLGGDAVDLDALASAFEREARPEDWLMQFSRPTDALRLEFAALCAARLRRRTIVMSAVACMPLPFVVVYARYVLQHLYEPLATVLAPQFVNTVAGAHVALLALLFGATYAAIPLWLDRLVVARA